jgi:hypothetical protein
LTQPHDGLLRYSFGDKDEGSTQSSFAPGSRPFKKFASLYLCLFLVTFNN